MYLLVIFFGLAGFFVLALVMLSIVRRKKVKGLGDDLKTNLSQTVTIGIVLSNFPLTLLVKWLKIRVEITRLEDFSWERGKVLVVSNHPSWLDQAALIQSMISYLDWIKNPNCFPYVGAARDSIIRLPFLKFLETFYILTPIGRYGSKHEAASLIRKLQRIIRNGGNLIISGPNGRDFKAESDEVIFSRIKGKCLRRFGGLCGNLASFEIEKIDNGVEIVEGVTTIPVYLENSDKLFKEVLINGKREMIFSLKHFLIDFLLLGKFQIKIVVGKRLNLTGYPREEARRVIEEEVLQLADLC